MKSRNIGLNAIRIRINDVSQKKLASGGRAPKDKRHRLKREPKKGTFSVKSKLIFLFYFG